ncbi:MAG: hypothetical protein Q4D98_03280 [Planctomycetia bacterium]|nr:hypothetical protein [Planctomycetia bacterium]
MKRVWILLLALVFAGVCGGCHHTFEREGRSGADPFDNETEAMRNEVKRVRPQESKGNVIYGGLSSEAQSIEDSLYGE